MKLAKTEEDTISMLINKTNRMERNHEYLQSEELYFQCANMIKDSIVGIKHEICSIKKFLGDRNKEIVKQLSRGDNEDEACTFEYTRAFYKYSLKELMKMEKECEECLSRMEIDLSTAIRGRMQPPSYISFKEASRAYRRFMCCNVFDEVSDDTSCRCSWSNVPLWNLEDTRSILLRPKEVARTEFDETDLMFKQDMIYLRTKMFSLPKKSVESRSDSNVNRRASDRLTLKTEDFTSNETSDFLSIQSELSKINNLKFIDGIFTTCYSWTKVLDVHGNQYGSKWYLILCPQIEKIMNDRQIPAIRLNPRATLDFISTIEENGANFLLLREDLIPLLEDKAEAWWLASWKLQFQTIHGKHIAATLIQACWRGYSFRKRKRKSERLYIAASLIWFSWITLKKKREIHQRYLTRMLTSLQATRELSLKLSKEFNSINEKPHVVLHLPSIGHPVEIRRQLAPKTFTILQNMMSLRICFARNPKSEVIYILPVKPTQDYLLMYSDFIESISPEEDVAKRITFIALSQVETFKRRSLNLSRILHCSEESLNEIRQKIAGKPAYFLPMIIDECDMRLAGNLNVALLSPDMELEQKVVNASKMAKMIDGFGLLQPPHVTDIRDYETLCANLSHLVVLHTEICMWLIKLNFGLKDRHCGIFLINHISIPFMPILRRERGKHGENWKIYSSLREEFYEMLKKHLPKVVFAVTRLTEAESSWKEFYALVQKFGCLLQAVPVEKHSTTIAISLFIPEKRTGDKPKWTGTADKMRLESTTSTSVYMLPQSSLDVSKLEPVVTKFAMGMQNEGYFGYLTVDCYCYMHKDEERLVVMLINIHPFYSHLQSYIDWMKFAIKGWYNMQKNQFVADVPVILDMRTKKSAFLLPEKTPKWNETTERYAIAISQLHHTRFSAYRWSKLKSLFEGCNIKYDAKTKQGASILLHDSEIRRFGLMVAVSPCMNTTLEMVQNSLMKLHQTLQTKSKMKSETNLSDLADFFNKLSLDYENLASDPCV